MSRDIARDTVRDGGACPDSPGRPGVHLRAESGHQSHAPGSSRTANLRRPDEPPAANPSDNPRRPAGGRSGGPFMTTIATRIPVLLIATDPILRNGLRTTLHSRPEIRVVDEDDSSPDTVVILVT